MCRFTKSAVLRRVTATVLVVVAAAVSQPTSATADLIAPGTPIVAPVVDIQFDESDLEGAARVERLPAQTSFTLDSNILFSKDSAKIGAKAAARLGTSLSS